jgi:hypothetical protein
MRYAASGPGPSSTSAHAALDYELAADGKRAFFGRQKSDDLCSADFANAFAFHLRSANFQRCRA